MEKGKLQEIIRKLLREVEEEDIGISLLSAHYQSSEELTFFSKESQESVLKILSKLCEDSKRHKGILISIVESLQRRLHAQ